MTAADSPPPGTVPSATDPSLLVNFVFAHPVGHAVEALHYAYGYHLADPSRRIAVALNSATPTELAHVCPFVDAVHPIRLDLFDDHVDIPPLLRDLPRTWDFIVEDARGRAPAERGVFPGLAAYYDGCEAYLDTDVLGLAGSEPPSYVPPTDFRIPLPDGHRDRAERRFGPHRPRIAILPGGSAARELYPSLASWRLILTALGARFPDATFCFVGKLADDDRTRTTFTRTEFDQLTDGVDHAADAVDLPLVDQLAAVAACDVLVSPHSGFGMATLAVGTPWLTIAGNRWPEYYFNGTPFYSVLPDLNRFACYSLHEPEPPLVDDDGPRSPSMSAGRIADDLDEIVDGAARLVERRWPYETAMRHHWSRMLELRDHDPSMLWSVDSVHLRYIADQEVESGRSQRGGGR